MIGFFALTLPDTADLTAAQRKPSITILAGDGTLVATYGDLFGEPLRLKEMPKYLPEAVIATEDRRFYSHFGIDPIGLARAAFVNLRAGHVVQGGSTITQQLAKNLFLTPDRTFTRKIQETLLAIWLEHKFPSTRSSRSISTASISAPAPTASMPRRTAISINRRARSRSTKGR